MRDVSNRRACKLTKTRSNYRGLGHFFPFPFSFSLSRFTCIESGKLRNAVNRKMTKQFSLALIINENKLGRQVCVCVYITYMCRLCDNSLTQVSGAHYQQQIITRGANVSGLHRHSRWYRANNFRRCVQTFRKFTCYENVPFIYKYFWFERVRIHWYKCVLKNDFKRNIAPSNQ